MNFLKGGIKNFTGGSEWLREEQYAGAQRHHQYMEDEDYRKECAIRAGAESLVNEVANGHGARKARHRSA